MGPVSCRGPASFFFHYLSRKLVDIIAALQENREPVMSIKHRSIRSDLQRARFSGAQRVPDCVR